MTHCEILTQFCNFYSDDIGNNNLHNATLWSSQYDKVLHILLRCKSVGIILVQEKVYVYVQGDQSYCPPLAM